MFNLNLKKFSQNSEIIISSLIFSKLKKFLTEKNKLELFPYISSIKNNNGIVFIKTSKPIVNAELKLFYEEITNIIKDAFATFGIEYKEVKVVFK
ncbi:hypothetical protein M0P65_03805 [Candidatus Gracilibacteria bacterium]|nr:hypothetical protein [Candidatus Gracilibacteria bacterium]